MDWDYVGRACRKVPLRDADDGEGEKGKGAGIARPRDATLDEVMREAPTDSTRMAIVDAIGPYRLEATQYMDDGTHMTSHSEGAFRGAEALTASHNESQQEVRPGRGKTAITAFGYTHAGRAALSTGVPETYRLQPYPVDTDGKPRRGVHIQNQSIPILAELLQLGVEIDAELTFLPLLNARVQGTKAAAWKEIAAGAEAHLTWPVIWAGTQAWK